MPRTLPIHDWMYIHTYVTMVTEDGIGTKVHMSPGNGSIPVVLQSHICVGSSNGARYVFLDPAHMSACAPLSSCSTYENPWSNWNARLYTSVISSGIDIFLTEPSVSLSASREHRIGSTIARMFSLKISAHSAL